MDFNGFLNVSKADVYDLFVAQLKWIQIFPTMSSFDAIRPSKYSRIDHIFKFLFSKCLMRILMQECSDKTEKYCLRRLDTFIARATVPVLGNPRWRDGTAKLYFQIE